MKITSFKSVWVSATFALLVVCQPSHAMMKHITTAAAKNSPYAVRVLKNFARSNTFKPAQTVFATHPSDKIFWPYAAATVAAVTAASNAFCQDNNEKQKSVTSVWVPKSKILLECSFATIKEITAQDRELLDDTFGYTHLTDLEHHSCIRAHISTPSGPKLVAIGLFKKQPDNAKILHLSWLAIDPDYQKKGVGTALITHLAKSTETPVIGLHATRDAYPFYIHIGFQSITGSCCYVEKEFKQEKL